MAAAGHATGRSGTGPHSTFDGVGISQSGSGDFSVGGDVNITVQGHPGQNTRFLADLRSTDPRDDKARIERTKGGLLRDSYCWILDHTDFLKWRDDNDQSRLLWIRGDPGKGKTMLLCGIIDELGKVPESSLSYFFCQATDARLNNATAVLRGLIYLLLVQKPTLVTHLREKYDHAGKKLFEDINSWDALSSMLFSILQDPTVQNFHLAIDALDECETDLNQLLHLIVKVSLLSRAKLIVSSRNWQNIEDALSDITITHKTALCLELNHKSISAAVGQYIQYKVNQLVRAKKYDSITRDAVQQHLVTNANDTFLWVALVCQELADPQVRRWHTHTKLRMFPPGLDSLYKRMADHMFKMEDADLCRRVLGLISVAYRPLTLIELMSLVESPEDFPKDIDSIKEIIWLCGSLLTVREGIVYFVHQSAKDFLLTNESARIYPNGIAEANRTVVATSLQVMSRTLRRDIYSLHAPGFSIDQVKAPEPDPLATARYSCVYWVNHLADGELGGKEQYHQALYDGGPVHAFLEQHYLHWLEALSLLRSLSQGILQLHMLVGLAKASAENSMILMMVKDGLRFIRAYRAGIESSPLQTYTLTFMFTPRLSIIRALFGYEKPAWITTKPEMENEWDACLQTLEGHGEAVTSVAFSGDGLLASASWDTTVKIWDSTTGQCLHTLEGHSEAVNSVDFLGDGRLASASDDTTVKIWDSATGYCLQTLKGHLGAVRSVAFLGDRRLASASWDKTVKIWDSTTGQCLQTLEGHSEFVNSVAFSGDGRLASASGDTTVKIWDSATGRCLQTLEGHSEAVRSVAFLGDRQLASASSDKTIKVWDSAIGSCLQTLGNHLDTVRSVAFLGDRQLASASGDTTVKIWDVTTGQCLHTLEGHSEAVNSVAFSGDRQLASASDDYAVKIWDSATGRCLHTLEGHSEAVKLVAFLDDRRLASASWDKTVKVWNVTTGQCLQTLKGHNSPVNLVASSGDGLQLASALLYDNLLEIWDSTTGQCLHTLEGHSKTATSLAFLGDDLQLASASDDNTVKVWDITTGRCLQTFQVGRSLWDLSFSKIDQQLCTEMGIIDIGRVSTTSTGTSSSLSDVVEIPRFYGYGISADNAWITRNSVNTLWLPPEYRPWTLAATRTTLAFGCASGRVLVMRFSEDEPTI
ncbi:hypothetical protein EsH8_VI_000595 [Colletotrichum jinshuiense]